MMIVAGDNPSRIRSDAAFCETLRRPVRYQPRAESRTGTGCSAEATGKPTRRSIES